MFCFFFLAYIFTVNCNSKRNNMFKELVYCTNDNTKELLAFYISINRIFIYTAYTYNSFLYIISCFVIFVYPIYSWLNGQLGLSPIIFLFSTSTIKKKKTLPLILARFLHLSPLKEKKNWFRCWFMCVHWFAAFM